eukprot:gb/GECH01010635.1/.p1 GENE.gb/GECH01010635.1/~~gb/GECH01010635.1/.p1  ORF type:complete len:1257 (+),score=245.31 gb/GECH01010635.1/:1-3771(+)
MFSLFRNIEKNIQKQIETAKAKDSHTLDLSKGSLQFKLKDDGCKHLKEQLQNETQFTELKLKNNAIGIEGYRDVFELLKNNKTISRIDLSDNPLSDSEHNCFQHLNEILIQNSSLNYLTLSGCNLNLKDIQYISEGIKQNYSLQYLNISKNNICKEGCEILAQVLKTDTGLRDLDLSQCKMLCSSLRIICQALEENTTLEKLSLNGNPLRNDGCEQLKELLLENTSLLRLEIKHCNIGSEGYKCLTNALKTNSNLRELDIRLEFLLNKSTDILEKFQEVLQENHSLVRLDFRGTNELMKEDDLNRQHILGIISDQVDLYESKAIEIQKEIECNLEFQNNFNSKMTLNNLVVLGDSGVGKTSLIRSLNGLKLKNPDSTQGVKIDSFCLNSKDSQEQIRVQTFDCGQQNSYRYFYQLIAPKNCVYLLVFNALKFEQENLNSSIEMLSSVIDVSHIPLIVVITHCKEIPECRPHHEKVTKFVRIDNDGKYGIKELREELKEQFLYHPDRSTIFSGKRKRIYDRIIENKNKLFITRDEFITWAQEEDINEDDEISSLLNCLCQNRIVFHFPQIKELQDIIWISSNRFIEGIRCVLIQSLENSELFQNGILKNLDTHLLFQRLVRDQTEEQQQVTIDGLIKLLYRKNLMFPIKTKHSPVEIYGYITPHRLPLFESTEASKMTEESQTCSKKYIKRIPIPSLFLKGVFGKLISVLWKYNIENSQHVSCFGLKCNKSKAMIRCESKNDLWIVCWGEDSLKLLSKIYHASIEIMECFGIDTNQVHEKMASMCPFCYQNKKKPYGSWNKSIIYERFFDGTIHTECNNCNKQVPLTELLFDENLIFIGYHYGSMLNNELAQNLDHIRLRAEELRMDHELYPICDDDSKDDKDILKNSCQTFRDWSFLDRVGKSRFTKKYYGSNAAVYIARSLKENLKKPDRFYAIKIVYNIFGVDDEKQLLNYTKSEHSIMEKISLKRSFVRQVCHFVDKLKIDQLPKWDATLVKDNIPSLFVVSEACDGMLKHHWSSSLINSPRTLFGYILQILHCLLDLQQQVVHRDIKSDNFFYSSDYDCFLLSDFGEAKILNSSMTYDIGTESLWGMPQAMPPEVEPEKTIDFSRADLFSSGCMFLALMSRQEGNPLEEGFNVKSDEYHAETIHACIGTENEDRKVLSSLIYQMVREKVKDRISVHNAIKAISYYIWGQCAAEASNIEEWKRQRIYHISKKELTKRKMKMNDILEMEYVANITKENVEEGKIQFENMKNEFC